MIDLSTLVAPLDAEEFLRDHWPHTPYWSSAGVDRLAPLTELPELQSAEAALSTPAPVTVFRPGGGALVTSNGEEALRLYSFGLTCYLDTRHIPALKAAADALAADLGLPGGSIVCELFCSQGDTGVAIHSDFDSNLALLIRGEKRWRIAENTHIRNQTGLCTPPSLGNTEPSQLGIADRLPFPEEMPENATTIDVQPGGLLFLPRGWWHETQPSGECMQINFVMKRPLWMSVLTKALKNHLLHDIGWRGFAYGMFGAPDRREAAVHELAELLPQLRDLFTTDDYVALAKALIEQSGLEPASSTSG